MLELVNITKLFGKHIALDGVNLQVEAGEIHGLVGLNGSGKSTLLNILFGNRIITETGGFSGSYYLGGKSCKFKHPHQAVAKGIGMVHQELALIPELSAAENILLTREPVYGSGHLLPRALSPVNAKRLRQRADDTIKKLGIDLGTQTSVVTLSLNLKQFIEIAREVSRDQLRLLLLDEPTAAFNTADVVQLQKVLRDLAAKGVAIIFVSHRMSEILTTCDRVTVLRDGKVSGRLNRDELSPAAITGAMVPHDIIKIRKAPVTTRSAPRFRIRNFRVKMAGDELRGIDLAIQPAEIFGLTGISGSGRNSLGYGIMGLCASSGHLQLNNKDICITSPEQMLRSGFFLLPEERQKMGLLLNHSIRDNISFSPFHTAGRFTPKTGGLRRFFPDTRAISVHADQCIRTFAIGCRDSLQKTSELSGGNQQKVCMAHALTLAPQVLFINEPTRGVDIAAKEIILEQIIATSRMHSTTIIISSSELEELRRICDRIGVLYKGRLQAIFPPETSDTDFAGVMMGEGSEA